MKCQFCNQELVQWQTKFATMCRNHKTCVNYYPSFTGYTLFKRNSNYLSIFIIQNYVDKNQCVIEYFGNDNSDFSVKTRIVLDFIPDWDPDADLEEKILDLDIKMRNLAAWI